MPALAEVQAEIPVEEPQVEIEVDLAKAETHQVKPGEVRRQASSLISGIQVGNLYQDQKIFDVVVWGNPEIRTSLTNIRNLLIDTPGGQVPLSEVAEVRIVPVPTIIRRDSVARFMDVTANVSSGSIAAAAAAIEGKLMGITFPLEHHVELLAEATARAAAGQRTIYFVIAALFGIFLLLQAATRKWSMAALTFATLPMALAGGAVAALLGGGVLTIGALFGFLGVLAIALRNTFALFKHFHHLEREAGQPFSADLISRGAGERFGPIVTTAITTILALAPFIFLGNIAGHEVVRPLAIVMVGGLVTATLFNLLVVPTLYVRFGYATEAEFVDSLYTVEQPSFLPAD